MGLKKLFVVTSSRADYGILRPLITRLSQNEKIEFKLIVTGTHISRAFGYTLDEILDDFGSVPYKIIGFEGAKTDTQILAKTMTGFESLFAIEEPDMVVLLGDRSEIFGVASVCNLLNIPIAHLHGGENTFGAFDEGFRHSITKFSQLHFPCCEKYRRRVIQLGEQPDTVFNYGALGVENIKNLSLMTRDELEESLGIPLLDDIYCVTYHDTTNDGIDSEEQVREIINVLDDYEGTFIFTKGSNDASGEDLNNIIEQECNKRENWHLFASLGLTRYLSVLKIAKMCIGNSSSGIIEAPVFKIPTINIGSRQDGRIKSKSVFDCGFSAAEIKDAIDKAGKADLSDVVSEFGDGNTSAKMEAKIIEFLEKGVTTYKTFYDIQCDFS